jgi:hypothetical protein
MARFEPKSTHFFLYIVNNNDSLTIGTICNYRRKKMADRNKFEEMLERLINEDREGAEELFHEIVVEKSRDIYESILENDLVEAEDEEDEDEDLKTKTGDKGNNAEVKSAMPKTNVKPKKKVKEAEEDEEDEEDLDEGFDLEEFEVEAEDDMMGGDATDDLEMDVEMPDAEDDMDMDDEEEGDMEDRVEDLEDALDELKAEFEELMAGEKEEPEHSDMDMDDEGEEEGEEEAEESFTYEEDEEVDERDELDVMREYVEKVGAPSNTENGVNAKSPVAGKNDMGGTASNIAAGSAEENGGSAQSAKEENAGNVNVPGGKASKSMKGQKAKDTKETGADTKPVIGG